MVTSNAFRNPALTAKMAATVDLVSGGRLELGLGAGVQSQEHAAYGFDFPSFRVRVQRLTESLQIITSLWTQEKTTYKGAHFRVVDAVCEPKPVQKPHPPLVVGGSGERYLLKVTAQYADRFDFSYLPTIELYQHKLHVLESHCKAVGRNFDEIEKSCWPQGQIILGSDKAELEQKIANLKPKGVSKEAFAKAHFLGTPQQYVDTLKPYLDLGVTYFMQYFADLPDVDSLQLFAPFIKN
jgi:alkanesulfonate monooxygenase SsuD/methylene tetrahydromethanopterin reductase-like flavin-dependent oxidoreductase (luciferase family)